MTIRVISAAMLVLIQLYSIHLHAAEHGTEELHSAVDSRFLTGDCLIAQDPKKLNDDPFPMTCVRAKLFTEALAGTDSSVENLWLLGGAGYAGLHLSSWMSIHAEGKLLRAEGSKVGRELVRDQEIEVLTLNLGNPALHRWRVVAGRPQLTFGVAESPVMESFQLLGSRKFWGGLNSGVVAIYDNMRDMQVEVGGFSTVPRARGVYEKREGNDAAVVRMAYDIPALDGSRMLVSFYGDRKEERRVGFAFINVSVKNDLTHFEFVRAYRYNGDAPQEADQLLRIGYVGAFRSSSRWVAAYDDVRNDYRLGVLGQDFQFRSNFSVRLGLGYRKGERPDVESRWFFATGANWSL